MLKGVLGVGVGAFRKPGSAKGVARDVALGDDFGVARFVALSFGNEFGVVDFGDVDFAGVCGEAVASGLVVVRVLDSLTTVARREFANIAVSTKPTASGATSNGQRLFARCGVMCFVVVTIVVRGSSAIAASPTVGDSPATETLFAAI